ncbi:MAG: nitroreductase family protein [Planctomycetota bacterium]
MDVHEAIRTRRSVRAYSDQPISDHVMARMRQALRAAPSACNIQPWHFVLVSDARLRSQLGGAAHNQPWIADAPIIVVGCGWPEKAYQRMGGYGNSVDIDVAIALDHLMLAAVSEGLGTCWIGSFSEEEVKRLLHVPPAAKVVAMTPLGYPASADLNAPLREDARQPEASIFSSNRFSG